jgi:hypothetical protein
MTFVSTISAFDGLIAVYVGLPCELSKPTEKNQEWTI